jgi:CarboxypepD_reg-like domain/Secretion system C-terminal sorting domain
MAKQLQLSIPTPCHEDWDNMTPVDKGKFCGSCQKQVVDFSNMNDRQVAEFFKKPSTGSVCGRFMADQLERGIEIPRKRIPWLKYFFQFAIPAFLLSIKSSSAKAQGTVTVVKTNKTSKQIVGEPLMAKCSKPLMGDTMIVTPVKYPVETVKGEISNITTKEWSRTIYGNVMDEKGECLPGVSIMIKGTRIGVSADNNGQFRILAKTGNELVLSGAGLETTEVIVGSGNSISIVVKRLVLKGGEIVVTMVGAVVRRPVRKEIKNVPLMKENVANPSGNLFKVFPNPIESGNSINIEIQKLEEGYYSLQLLDQSGQSVHQQEIWIDAEARLLSIDVPSVAAGSYFLSLINKKSGKRSVEKIIIQ